MSDLAIALTDRADGEVFDRFFAGYDRAFVLPEEKEDRDGFAACLALNHGAEHDRLTASYGPYRELCMVAGDGESGAPLGGANFIAMPCVVEGARFVTVNLNYVFVNPAARGRGLLRRLVMAVEEVAAASFQAPARTLIFLEQNDPFAMSAERYARDTRFTGLDQLDRLRIWARLGARIVDTDYVQPALSPDHAPDTGLLYAVLGASEAALPACLIAAHLRLFFGVSVLKGAPLAADPTAARQLAPLDAACRRGAGIALLDPRPLLEALPDRAAMTTMGAPPPASFREALRSFQAGDRARVRSRST